MMFKRILTLRTPSSLSFLTTSISSTSKVISRTLSEQNTDIDIDLVEKWDLLSAVCLERHPVITKSMLDIETRFHDMLQQVELENSMISDFEMQKQNNKNRKTVQDLEDSWKEEFTNFKFAERISKNEEDNAVVSLRRKLDKNLVLLVEQKIGDSNFWIPPQSIRKHRETMIQTAHRTIQELCGNNIKVKFYAKYVSGDISPDIKHCWLDREELKKNLHPDLHKSLVKFLLPD
ncbi:hypothetical protein QLX08_009276 [Tetragonisca angustula]|uniref:39S ribosomal protein L46, mitochondrial n=1 Tax=Tetragonisca angustula TaxID=166442 RepID=A0AAW0ZGX9_9HYME